MRLSSRNSRGPTVELQMTSMIDVTFLLLIFFMVTSSISKTERELDPQIKVNKQAPKTRSQPLETVIIDVVPHAERGGMFLLGGREFTSTDELVPVLRKLENREQGAFVRVSGDVPFDFAAQAIQACKSAGFTAVSYVPKEGS